MKRGALSLVFTELTVLFLILALVLLESVRVYGTALAFSMAGQDAVSSVFSSYEKALFDRYGILAFDSGYEDGISNLADAEDSFTDFVDSALGSGHKKGYGTFFPGTVEVASFDEARYLTEDLPYFTSAAIETVPYALGEQLLKEIKNYLGFLSEGEYIAEETAYFGSDTDDLAASGKEKQMDQEQRMLSDAALTYAGAHFFSEDTGVPEDTTISEILEDTPAETVSEIQAGGFLKLVLPEGTSISGVRMEEAPVSPEVNARLLLGADTGIDDPLKKVLFSEYLLTLFPNYRSPEKTAGLQYEAEYILFGKLSDEDNLKTMVNRLMWAREALNILSISTDTTLRTMTQTAAETLALWTGNPIIVLGVQAALIAAYAYAESIGDVRALLKGEKVPFLKTFETWSLDFGLADAFLNGETDTDWKTAEGITYNMYLRLFLYLSDAGKLTGRAMDMMETNIRKEYPNFHMDCMMTGGEIACTLQMQDVFLFPMVKSQLSTGGKMRTIEKTFSFYY